MKKSLKLFTGITLCFLMTLAVLMFTKKETEAATTVTTWTQLEDAIDNLETTITLGANITVPAGKSITFQGTNKSFTINGNGKTITVATGQAVSSKTVFYVQSGCSLTLNNVNFNGSGLYGCAVWCYSGSTKLTVNGGTYQNFYSFAINVVGAKDAVITGGTFKNNGKTDGTVGHPNVSLALTGTGTVSGGTFTGGGSAGLLVKGYSSSGSATFNISGVTCTGNTTVGLSTNNIENATEAPPATVNISGGSFSGNPMHGANVYPNVTVNVTGGSFNGNTSCGIMVVGGTLNVKGAKETSVMITGNKYGVYDTKETVNGTTYYGTANIYGATINANTTYGIYVVEGAKCTLSAPSIVTGSTYNIYTAGQTTVKGGTVSSATSNGVRVTSTGKLTVSGGSIKDSGSYGVRVYSGGTCSMSGGSITDNGSYGLYNAGSASITGGNVENNGGVYGDVYQDGTLTLLGTYDGRSSVKGYVYLAADSRYVSTMYSTTTINVRPNSYTDGRLVIRTYAPSFSQTQAGGTLYPKEGWRMVVSGSDVVLSNKYTVTCIDVVRSTSGLELGRSTWSAEYGTTASGATAGNDTTTGVYYEGYYYLGCSTTTVTDDDTTVYRYFMPQSYTVTCIDVAESIDGTVLGSSTKSARYGTTVYGSNFGSDVTMSAYYEGYCYYSCTSIVVPANDNGVVYRVFKLQSFTVQFLDYDGTVLKLESIPYGGTVTPPSNPTRAGGDGYKYVFSGWSPTLQTICKKAMVYTAQYEIQHFPVIRYNGNEKKGTLTLPNENQWYNADTIYLIKTFTATDEDGDVSTFKLYKGSYKTGSIPASELLYTGTVDGGVGTIKYKGFSIEGTLTYTFVAVDSNGNETRLVVTVKCDKTPPVLTGAEGTEGASGPSGSKDILTWASIVAVNGVVNQTASDALSGIYKIEVYSFSNQNDSPLLTLYDPPYTVFFNLNDLTEDGAVVVKAYDRADNMATKCLVDLDNFKIRIRPVLVRND